MLSLFHTLIKCSCLGAHGYSSKEGIPSLHSSVLATPTPIKTVERTGLCSTRGHSVTVPIDGVDRLGGGQPVVGVSGYWSA